MITCSKCKKRYDYEKYNGICPKCGRYNRKDSAVLESQLHEKYDADPAHSAVSHERVHEKNYDSYRHQTGDRRKPDGNFWGSEENYTKKRLVVVLVVMIVIVILFGVGTATGFFGYTDEAVESVFDYDGEEIDADSDLVEEIYLSYAYMDPLDRELTDVDWEEDHSVTLLDGDMEALEELETEYSGQEGSFYLMTVHVYNDTSEALDASSIVVSDIVFSDEEGTVWDLTCLKAFCSYWEMIEAGHNGYQDWLIFVPDDMLSAAEDEGYLTFSFTYETEQDGETVVSTYGDDMIYFD